MANSESSQNTFNISNSTLTNVAGSGDIHYQEASGKTNDVEEPKKVILFLAANPVATGQLRLDEEVREIDAGLRRAKYRDRFELKQQWALRPRDLQRAMLDHKPRIVHFSGHGTRRAAGTETAKTEGTRDISFTEAPSVEAGLVLEDVVGQPKFVSTGALSSLFGLFADSVNCVVLNACYSAQQAEAIAQHVPYVVGMTKAIGDRAAIEFSVGFYDALGAGETVELAYKLGCSMIQLTGIAEHLTPTIIRRADVDGEETATGDH
ncbi:MAG: CHAT domain-containing protein [Cyanobacteria bacterium J06634_6]